MIQISSRRTKAGDIGRHKFMRRRLYGAAVVGGLCAALLLACDQHPERVTAPGIELPDAAGRTVKLADYGGKVVLVNFWATWCRVCKVELPWMAQFEEQYGARGFAVLGISLDEGGWTVINPYLADHPLPYRILLGDTFTAREYGIPNALPDSFLIDRKGRIAMRTEGIVDRDATAALIQELLAGR